MRVASKMEIHFLIVFTATPSAEDKELRVIKGYIGIILGKKLFQKS